MYLAYCSAFTRGFEDWDSVLPPGDGPFTERLAAVNTRALGLFGDDERLRLGEFVTERGEAFLRASEGLAPDTTVATPWHGEQGELTLATATGLLLGESLPHGFDIARGQLRSSGRKPWLGPRLGQLFVSP